MPASAVPTAAVRAVRVALDGSAPAARAALLVGDDARPFALVGRWAGTAALAGSEPIRVAREDEDPFALLDEQPPLADAPAGFVGGGWFGMLGYGLGRRLEALNPPPPTPERLPGAVLAFYDHLLRCDDGGRWWFEALWSDGRAAALTARLETLRARVAGARGAGPGDGGGADPPGSPAPGPWRPTPSPGGHARAVAACRERIAAGDLFQANLSLRLRAALTGDPAALFTRGVEALAPDRAAFLSGPWGAIASLSPELFVARTDDAVRTAPIKGTRPRPADPAAAEALRVELADSAKDHAENVMIVDLMRNDLGRVCEPGSVTVTALAEVRPHAGVWHLVSEVVGRRRAGIGDAALVSALFPPGSVTGAPKLAAMDVISELEGGARQAFCGALGFASAAAGLELSVAIRTFECRDGAVWLDVGGGVVADSDPAAEAAECLAKARPLLAAIGGVLEADDPAPVAGAAGRLPAPLRLGAHPPPRPDPARGVFETVLVRGGIAAMAAAHLDRLAASAGALYAVELPAALPALLAHAALEHGGPCRIRVLVGADGEVALEAAPLPPGTGRAALEPVVLAGGLGAHKWRDRRWVDALEAAVAPGVPLLVDLDGLVLETTRANVLAVLDGVLVTPPLDGRILPGVTRARALAEAAALRIPVEERPLPLGELMAAEAVLTSGALRGLEVVAAVAGAPVPEPAVAVRALVERLGPRG